MHAIRKTEIISDIHSLQVDQWDWEKVISKDQRCLDYLKQVVEKIYSAIYETKQFIKSRYPELIYDLPKEIKFIHSEDLLAKYPSLLPKQREYEITKEYGAVFIIGIGHELGTKGVHDKRATDYDDWSTITYDKKRGLNGDILIWDHTREQPIEISSMGIRVDKDSLLYQLEKRDELYKKDLLFHKGILKDKLPLSIGGGIGQSRLFQLLLEKSHIAEVQASIWPKEVVKEAESKSISIL
jgi:aspartate--ammonia ligase